jgi:DNA-binding IscR family transcriptional regulator
MSQLKKHGIINIPKGTGGIDITRSAKEISFLDIYHSVESSGEKESQLFKIHSDTAPNCPVGGNIQDVITPFVFMIQEEFKSSLGKISLASVLAHLRNLHNS